MTMTESELAEYISELKENSEAGNALVTVALVDYYLKLLLLAAMQPVSRVVADRIFGSYGPLYELAPKADIAFAFGLINEDTLAQLRILRDVRNAFAHTRQFLHFNSPEIEKLVRKFPSRKQNSNIAKLFDNMALHCVWLIDKKTNELISQKTTSPGK